MPMPQVPLPTPPLMPMPPKISISDSCFGQVVTGYVENSDIILKPEGIINNRIIELTKYPNCSVTLDIDKPIGKIYVPFAYKLTFQGDADFYSKNFWFTAEGQDANGIRVQPCEGFVFNAATNSQKPFVCSYYDKAPEGSRVVPPKNQPFFDKSCAAASTKLKFNFSIGGPSRAVINNLVISELRIQLPTIESCP